MTLLCLANSLVLPAKRSMAEPRNLFVWAWTCSKFVDPNVFSQHVKHRQEEFLQGFKQAWMGVLLPPEQPCGIVQLPGPGRLIASCELKILDPFPVALCVSTLLIK